jgi:uncharacterized DUF497 family protein
VRISYDRTKWATNLEKHGFDFEDAAEVFADPRQQTDEVTREDYGEPRFVTVGHVRGRLVVVVWTPRGGDERRVISMRKANAREQARFAHRLGEGRRDDG